MQENIFNERYQIINELGRQTNRRTYLAMDLTTQKQIVVKVLFLGKDFDWQDLKLFEREAETLKQINHPAIPKYLDYFEIETDNDKGFGLVQTYVDAPCLETQLKSGRRFSEAEIIQLAASLLKIIDYLHQQTPAIIHRDIKPSNILLANRSGNYVGDVYLVDFGSVQNLAAQEGGTITVVGTYGYMPPEQFGGRTKPASDLYSLGATLIYLITGLHPTELPQKDLSIQFREVADVSQKLGDWLEWMTEPSLERRFATAQIALEAIDNPPVREKNYLEDKPIFTKPLGSKIKLIQTEETLQIIFPATGFGLGLVALISCLIPLAIGFVAYTNLPLFFQVFIRGLQVSAIAFLLLVVFSALYQRTQFIFDQEHLTISNHLFAWKRSQQKMLLSDFQQVKLIKDLNNTGIHENLSLIFDKSLDHRNRVYQEDFSLERYINLSIAEREWLAQEISEWMNLEVVGCIPILHKHSKLLF